MPSDSTRIDTASLSPLLAQARSALHNAANPARLAQTQEAEKPSRAEDSAELSNQQVAVRATTGQARISNALTRAEAVALYREVAAML